MKKLFPLLLSFLLLTGCGIADRNNIMGLLSAPKLSERENRIITAINDYLGSEIVLKYPKQGGNISPLHFADLDGDGKDEAVVLYSDVSMGIYVRIAVLNQSREGWQVIYDTEGYGSEIYRIDFEDITAVPGREIAVSYAFADSREKILSVYFIEEETLRQEYNITCQNYAIYDITADGVNDIVLAGINADNHRTRLKILSTHYTPEKLSTLSSRQIDVRNVNVTNIALTKSRLGARQNIIVDYRDSYNRVYTEAYSFDGRRLTNVLHRDVVQKYWYFGYDLNSRDIDNDGYYETPTIIDDGSGNRANIKQMEWTCFLTEQPQRKYYGVCEADSGVFFPLPDEWQNHISFDYNDREKSWQVLHADTELLLVEFRIVPSVDSHSDELNSVTVGKGTVQVQITFDESVTGDQRGYISSGLTDIR